MNYILTFCLVKYHTVTHQHPHHHYDHPSKTRAQKPTDITKCKKNIKKISTEKEIKNDEDDDCKDVDSSYDKISIYSRSKCTSLYLYFLLSSSGKKKPTTNITKPSGGVLVNWVVIRLVFFGRTDIRSIARLDGRTIDRTFRVSNS